ncbi:hypothetical protein [Mediterranea massiliensis]|uniref:hypothetical protein n=1 Tax=Mediterranea massiliensis TaxID=1841865 RepID=UPI0025A4BA5D|nr:hypothetical protein [Mediterranea massiliensis]MDM8336042.1 hypothetical protein [Mediterranea massiliensis]
MTIRWLAIAWILPACFATTRCDNSGILIVKVHEGVELYLATKQGCYRDFVLVKAAYGVNRADWLYIPGSASLVPISSGLICPNCCVSHTCGRKASTAWEGMPPGSCTWH